MSTNAQRYALNIIPQSPFS